MLELFFVDCVFVKGCVYEVFFSFHVENVL